MDKSDDELLKSLISVGIIGGTLAAILSDKKNRGENAALAAIAGAAIVASYQASQKAKETNLPIYKIKNGSLIIEHPDGRVETLKENVNGENTIPPKFNINY
jgi:AICAR transformylase/IMP cyclohydrolase PurH